MENLVRQFREAGLTFPGDNFMAYYYDVIVSSLRMDGCTIDLMEGRVLFDCNVSINGVSSLESRYARSLHSAYKIMLKYVENGVGITAELLQELSHLVGCGESEYRQIDDSAVFLHGRFLLSDKALESARGGKRSMENAESGDKISQLLDLSINLSDRIREIDENDIRSQYELSIWAHNMVLHFGLWKDSSGRMARLLMNWIQLIYRLPLIRFNDKWRTEYLEAIKSWSGGENPRAVYELVERIVMEQTLADICMYSDMKPIIKKRNEPRRGVKNKLENERVYNLLCENNTLTARKMASELQLPHHKVTRALIQLREDGRIKHFGSNKAGHWEVIS